MPHSGKKDEINMISLKFIFGLLIFIFLLYILAIINSWYWIYTWFDMPMHFLGGFWLAVVFLYLSKDFQIPACAKASAGRQNPKFIKLPNYLITIVITLGFVALIGVFWEFFEFGYDVLISSKGYLGVAQQGTADTMSDLFFDLIGGLVFLIVYKYFLKNNDAKIQENKDYFLE